MGHTRLGNLPKTRKWAEILDLLGSESGGDSFLTEGGMAQLAFLTIDAADGALNRAKEDPGLKYTFYLLTQLALSARTNNWEDALTYHGLKPKSLDTASDLAIQFQDAVDEHLRSRGHSSDVSEMAQVAAGETLSRLASTEQTLFGDEKGRLQDAIRTLSTKKGFSELGQTFFANFIFRFANFYLSRATAERLGTSRFQQLGDVSKFNTALDTHCKQTARIVRDFCGEWFSKTQFKTGINEQNAAAFVGVAVKKLQAELRHQRKSS